MRFQTPMVLPVPKPNGPYRLELLPVVPPFYRRARRGQLEAGQLVYYGPQPLFYGIGEVLNISEQFVQVDFHGTGQLRIHEDVFERQYLIPIPPSRMALL